MIRPTTRSLLRPLVLAGALLAVADAGLALRARLASSACAGAEHGACAAATRAATAPPADAVPDGPAVLEFTSDACPACRRLQPVLEEARRTCPHATAPLVRVDVESSAGGALGARWRVTATPTLVLLDAEHAERARLVGAQPLDEVRRTLERAYGLECASLPPGAASPG